MEWYFEHADKAGGKQYYYIVNAITGDYLYRTGTAIYMKTSSEKTTLEAESDNGFKFYLIPRAAAGSNHVGYSIVPYGETTTNFVSKPSGNNNAAAVKPEKDDNDYKRWNFVTKTDLMNDLAAKLPFTPSSGSSSTYYKIENGNTSGGNYYVIPPASESGNATATISDDDAVVKSGSWYFIKVQDPILENNDPSQIDWLTYYKIINAETGKALYYAYTANNSNCLKVGDYDESNDNYRFAFVKSPTTDYYYIVPKAVKDNQLANFSTFYRDDSNIKPTTTRASGSNAWTFPSSSFTCDVPEVTYDEENDQIIITSPNGADVYYNVNDENDVSISNVTKYTAPIANNSSTQVIKALCARNGDGSDKSAEVTIIFNPTITLSTGASITYDGQAHQPTITSAKNGETTIAVSEYELGGYLNENGETVTGCKDAGDYTIVLSNLEGGDYYVYGSTTFTIDPKELPVTANENQSKEYGDPDPVLTYTCDETAIVSGDVVADIQTGELGRAPGEAVGTYAINEGTLAFTNYSISFTGADFEITQKSLGSGNTPAPNITCDITETGDTHSIVVKQGGSYLTLGTDYTKDDEREDAKYYDVTVTGIGNYKDGFSVKLAKIKLSKLTGSSEPGGAALFVSNITDGDFEVPSNMKAYIVTGISGNTLVLEELDNIPENEPVLLLSTIDANGFVVQPEASATPPTGTNLLEEVTDGSQHFDTAEIYLLYKGEFVLNMEGYLAKGKIYLPRPSNSSPARLGIIWERDTSIDAPQLSVLNAQLPGTWYTLDGRRLNGQPTKKGLYLWKGKKVVVK